MRRALALFAIVMLRHCDAQSAPAALALGGMQPTNGFLATAKRRALSRRDVRLSVLCQPDDKAARRPMRSDSPATLRTARDVGIMSDSTCGPVDVAWVTYPLAATHHGYCWSTDSPDVNAEDLTLLDQKGLQGAFSFRT